MAIKNVYSLCNVTRRVQALYCTVLYCSVMLLAVSRHNLSEDLVTGDSLPIPALPGPADTLQPGDVAQVSCDWWTVMVVVMLSSDWSRQFLKLILGVAVTCSNKLLFISKIQSLDETTQHALTACIVSFISTKVGNR